MTFKSGDHSLWTLPNIWWDFCCQMYTTWQKVCGHLTITAICGSFLQIVATKLDTTLYMMSLKTVSLQFPFTGTEGSSPNLFLHYNIYCAQNKVHEKQCVKVGVKEFEWSESWLQPHISEIILEHQLHPIPTSVPDLTNTLVTEWTKIEWKALTKWRLFQLQIWNAILNNMSAMVGVSTNFWPFSVG